MVDILPPEKPTPSQQPKKPGIGVFKNMFRKKSSESSSLADTPDDVFEEMFEDGSAMLSHRYVINTLSFCLLNSSILLVDADNTCVTFNLTIACFGSL